LHRRGKGGGAKRVIALTITRSKEHERNEGKRKMTEERGTVIILKGNIKDHGN
jgi:hypothetical protein